ncbi:MAG: hydrogenase nickel incorporation protein HypA [Candidatus Bathyarchaeia archaeon]|nr:hydrogenase nickel incorporation protein HypA [Candidatus Bathyarchaeota archaeon]
MHEWALAEAIISSVIKVVEKEGLIEVKEVRIKVGELQQVDIDILEFALSELKTDKLKNARFVIETVKAELRCRACGHLWNFSQNKLDNGLKESVHFVPETIHAYIRCPKCGSPDFEILEGRGVLLESVKGVK